MSPSPQQPLSSGSGGLSIESISLCDLMILHHLYEHYYLYLLKENNLMWLRIVMRTQGHLYLNPKSSIQYYCINKNYPLCDCVEGETNRMMVLLAIELPQSPSFMASPWEKSKGASESNSVSYTVMSDSLRPHGLLPTRLLCPWDSPGKGTGMGCQSHLQGNLPDPGMEPGSPALQVDSSPLSHQGSQNTGVGSLSLLQWIFPTQEPNQVSCIAGEFSPSEPPGSPRVHYIKVSSDVSHGPQGWERELLRHLDLAGICGLSYSHSSLFSTPSGGKEGSKVKPFRTKRHNLNSRGHGRMTPACLPLCEINRHLVLQGSQLGQGMAQVSKHYLPPALVPSASLWQSHGGSRHSPTCLTWTPSNNSSSFNRLRTGLVRWCPKELLFWRIKCLTWHSDQRPLYGHWSMAFLTLWTLDDGPFLQNGMT